MINRITTPLTEQTVGRLKAGMRLLIDGTIITARDAAHVRIIDDAAKGKKPPFDPQGTVIYYVGPTPTPPGKIIGAAGPTTSSRMDPFMESMLKLGIKGFIGKGQRSEEVVRLLKKYRAVYCAAIGGAGALIAQKIKSNEIIAFPELGPEAVRRLEVRDFPVIVVNDVFGNDALKHLR
ncbi:MAG: TRZ/ATZ family protein [Elusimicrobia bacterium]|nr:TRZ/ATZ family protein [Elusimicrobiota bacterium]MBD3411553.1 TRZ/ATZ family protein [Elusimicrobiota bacterium]